MSDTLPPGVLPNITDTDPPPLHPSTEVGDGFVGAPPFCEDTPHVTYDGTTLSCTMGNWISNPDSYAYQWQMDGSDVEGATDATYTPQPTDSGDATCNVTATNAYGSTAAPPSNAVTIAASSRRRRAAQREEPEEEHPHANPDHPEHHSWLERMGRHGRQERAGRHE